MKKYIGMAMLAMMLGVSACSMKDMQNSNPCSMKKTANPCNPCSMKKAANPCNPCNPCSMKKAPNPATRAP